MSNEHLQPLESETQPITLGRNSKFKAPFPTKGPLGGRVVCDAVYAVVEGQLTVATALWNGLDVSRLINRATVTQRSGGIVRWNLTGAQGRRAAIKYDGIRKWHEHANVPIGAANNIALYYRIPFKKKYAKRGKDFAIPADELKEVYLDWGALSDLQTGTTVLSAPTGFTCRLLAEWHEEYSGEVKSVDVVSASDISTTTQGLIKPSGAIHDLDIMKEGTTAGGGEDVSGITKIEISELAVHNMTPLDFTKKWRSHRELTNTAFGATPNNEYSLQPITASPQQDIPILSSTEHTAAWDGIVVESFIVKLQGGVSGCSAVMREIVPIPEAAEVNVLTRFKYPAGSTPRMKTEGKSRRDLSAGWSPYQLLVGCKTYGKLPGWSRP